MESSFGKACIVTEEISGLNKSGGIGACALGLTLHLTALGYQVEVLVTDMVVSAADISRFQESHPDLTITLLSAEVSEDDEVASPVDSISKAYCVYRFIKRLDPDVVHFNDWLGSGFYCAMARRQGSLRSRVVTHLHGSSEWVRRYNRHIPSLENFEVEGIEKSQIENSDLVVGPSRYLLDWYAEHNIKLPESRVINWLLPQWFDAALVTNVQLRTREVVGGGIDTLVFFGRHERRKGFEVFLDAVARFPEDFHPNIVFMGRFDRIDREFTGSMALRKLRNYGGEIHFINDFSQPEAMGFLKRRKGALCVMPSLIENSPCVIGECFTVGVPFVASAVGGIPELFEDKAPQCLANPDGKDLSAAILRIANDGMGPIISSLKPTKIMEEWEKLHAILFATPGAGETKIKLMPLVSVCITHYERPKFLELALKHLNGQTYENIEIIVVDDGSTSAAATKELERIEKTSSRFPIRVVRTSNNYLGAARNAGARVARGEYILFHDDDNVAEPHEIETFVSAAVHSDSDILTCQAYIFRANDARGPFADAKKRRSIEYYPIGIGGVFSFFKNRFGDANALIKKDVFEKLGGFSELRGVGVEDWELFLKAYMRGFKTGVVPAPLFHYRVSTNGMLATGHIQDNHERIFTAVDHAQPALVGDILRYANRNELAQGILDQTWYRLGKEVGGALQHELMALDPNSSDARGKLSDLALEIGRIKDAVQLALPIFEQREKLLALTKILGADVRSNLQQHASIRLSSGVDVRGYFLEGWFVDKEGRPDAPDGILIDKERYTLLSANRYDRPDVQSALELSSSTGIGIRALVRKEPSGRLGSPFRAKPRQRIRIDGIGEVALLKASGKLRGHVDKAVGYTSVSVTLPDDGGWSGGLEILVEDGVRPAINWGPGVFDFGLSYGANRKTYSAPKGGVLPRTVEIYLPADTAIDVFFR
ncbi:glycosyltransferase [Rhizobium mayense]|uniref:Glycosyltransferase n=1 Tax=Rhizobium mayense TaxID=1312184 RepID=A0ABT7K5D7_9HYPH|nr:glycosyltransferase [Rhizobium mayense]MDL2403830.1 glycosyltransferase [Rhizobium mayense]